MASCSPIARPPDSVQTVRRAGGAQKDFTKIEITAKPLEMVEDSASIDKNRVTVEIQAGERGLVVSLTLAQTLQIILDKTI